MQAPILFDLETDGLLDTVSRIHCLSVKDLETGERHRWEPHNIEEGIRWLNDQHVTHKRVIGGHNVISYDIQVIQKLYPWFTPVHSDVVDTLVMARLIFSNIKDVDTKLLKQGKLPGKLWGAHKLEAYGYRLGLQKGEYAHDFKARMGDAYEPGMEWWEYSPEMGDYCDLDVDVTEALFLKLVSKEYSIQAIQLEHRVAWLIAKQVQNGFYFNVAKASELYAVLVKRRTELERELREFFKFWLAPDGPPFTPKVNRPKLGVTAGCTYTKVKLVEFNPSSRDHIADRLIKLYGWKPERFTEKGKPQVDEDVMRGLDYPPCKLLTEYLTVAKRASQLAEGDQAWLKVEKQGRIHGSVNPNGAVTGRATHAYPNVAQVPAVYSPYGKECRELFYVPKGWVLVGSDASGLELRCLAHFMARYDGGKYGDVILNGDIHTANQNAAGLPTRDNAKTFIYAFLYGAGDEKIGKVVNKDAAEGKRLKAKFLKQTPALKYLIDAVRGAAKKGHLLGLDGRKVHVRSSHAALNTLLQSAGALICKEWIVRIQERMAALGYKHGWDGDFAFCAWVHDECQVAVRSGLEGIFMEQVKLAMSDTEETFKFRCRLDCESKVGANWKETH